MDDVRWTMDDVSDVSFLFVDFSYKTYESLNFCDRGKWRPESIARHLNLLLMCGSCSVTATDTILQIMMLLKWQDSFRFVNMINAV